MKLDQTFTRVSAYALSLVTVAAFFLITHTVFAQDPARLSEPRSAGSTTGERLPDFLKRDLKTKSSGALVSGESRKRNTTGQALSPTACIVSSASVGGPPINGVLTADDCLDQGLFFYDIYTFTVQANQTVSITMNSAAVDAYLLLLTNDGNVLAEDDDSGGGTDSRIVFTFTTAGTYRVWASTFFSGQTGPYTLSLSNSCPAPPISVGDTINGTITTSDCQSFPGNFVDEYTFDGTPGQNIVLTANSSSFGFSLSVEDASGGFIAFDSTTPGFDALVLFSVTDTGPYRVRIDPFSNGMGNYTLTVRNAVSFSGQLQNENGDPIDCETFIIPGPAGQGFPAPCEVPMTVSCANGFSATYFVASIFSILVPQNSGNCTLTPEADIETQFGVTAWSPSSVIVSSAQSQSGIAFLALGPAIPVSGTINPSAAGVTMHLYLLNTGVEVGGRCSVDQPSRAYTCSMTKFSSYRAAPSHATLTSEPMFREYRDIALAPPPNTQNYTMVAAPILSIGNSSVTEGNSGTTSMNFTVNLSIAQSQPVTVNYSTTGGSATPGTDFQPVTNETVTISPGQTSGTATVQVMGDTIADPGETFTVNLSNAQGAMIGQGTATGSINDDDLGGTIRFSSVAYSVSENAGNASITINRSDGSASGVSVVCRTVAGGSATPNQDYTPVAQTITFNAGVNLQTCSVPILADSNSGEPNETVQLIIDTPAGGASIGFPSSAELTIVDPFGRPALFDYDGDRRSDVSVFRPGNRVWYLQNSAGFFAMQWGEPGDMMAPADFNGDGRTDLAMFRPSTGTWYIFYMGSGTIQTQGWGQNGDVPMPADHDGDGRAELVVFRPSNNTWYKRSLVNGAISTVAFGATGDWPLLGDFDGDLRWDVAVFRPSNRNWYRLTAAGFFVQTWGEPGDIPAPADYDGDGKTDLAIFRPSTGQWYRIRSSQGFDVINWGQLGDRPIPADYDGDGRADPAVFRTGNVTWYIFGSSSGIRVQQYGQAGDLPTEGAFVYTSP